MGEDLYIGGTQIKLGERKRIELEVARLYDFTEMTVPIEVISGAEDGPRLFVSAALHGDEINGLEIIKRLLKHKSLKKIKGTLIAIPIVNVYGFNNKSRYMPDRRDLNRCFPGSQTGSLGSQLANILMKEVIGKCRYGIDLHTGANHRKNLPQVRGFLDDPETKRLALSFATPVILNSSFRDGSLRQAAADLGIPTLVYEGGEALRFDEDVIKIGLHGVLSVMQSIGMIDYEKKKIMKKETFIAESSSWVRAPFSGTLRITTRLGKNVEKGDLLGVISDPFARDNIKVRATQDGLIIGISLLPLVNKGDAIFRIANFEDEEAVAQEVQLQEEFFNENDDLYL